MNVRVPKGLFKRGKGYAVRVAVPAEYQSLIGKKEIVRGLGTQDLGEALVRRKEVLEEVLTSLGEGNTPEPVQREVAKNQPSPVEGTTIRETAHRWLAGADGIKNSTRARYRQHLEAFADFSGNIEVTQVNRGLALEFMEQLKRISTRANYGRHEACRLLFISPCC